MGAKPNYLEKHYGSQRAKTLRNALAHRIGKEFPRIGGPRIRELCADLVLEVVWSHLKPRERLSHGQALWLAVSRDDPPAQGKTIAATDLVPVTLDLHHDEDLEFIFACERPADRLLRKSLRLCRQSHEQGGLLSNCDLALLLNVNERSISAALSGYEHRTKTLVPRRATLHDVGSALTHKGIICRKRVLQGKEPQTIARETSHSLEAVDRYLGQYDRVRHCRQHGMTLTETAYALNVSPALARQYWELDLELERAAGAGEGG
jgi:DNA-binding CsgD family transcriptional regulator